MQNDVLVSVIIPVYNTEQFLNSTITCLQKQTYTHWEAICIDDGSTDSSGNILDNYAKEDTRIKVIHKKNGGVSAARNTGIDYSSGQKILFLDSDDIFEDCLIDQCLAYINDNQVEAVLYGYANLSNGQKKNEHKFNLEKDIYRGQNEIVSLLLPHFFGISYEDINGWIQKKRAMRQGKEHTALWRIMCDACCIKNNQIYFNPELSLGEDTIFISNYLYYSKSVGVLDKTLYYLVSREGSANFTNNHDIQLMIQNKKKLIEAKTEFSEKVNNESRLNIRQYYFGNNVLSALQICIGLAMNREMSFTVRLKMFLSFCNDEKVRQSIYAFKPIHGRRSIPFWFIKYAKTLLFCGCSILPQNMFSKFV